MFRAKPFYRFCYILWTRDLNWIFFNDMGYFPVYFTLKNILNVVMLENSKISVSNKAICQKNLSF